MFFYRAKELAKQHPTGFEYWGCANRIVNGRAVCDSHHINEDVLYATYHAAVKTFHEHGVITQAQHGKSLHDLTVKMGYGDE